MNEQQSAAVTQLAHDARSSIELSVDNKGLYRWSIKRYHAEDEADAAIEAIHHADERLRNLFGTAGDESLSKLPY